MVPLPQARSSAAQNFSQPQQIRSGWRGCRTVGRRGFTAVVSGTGGLKSLRWNKAVDRVPWRRPPAP